MSYYKTCWNCGGALDPGERCDCEERTEQLRQQWERLVDSSEKQYTLKLGDINEAIRINRAVS